MMTFINDYFTLYTLITKSFKYMLEHVKYMYPRTVVSNAGGGGTTGPGCRHHPAVVEAEQVWRSFVLVTIGAGRPRSNGQHQMIEGATVCVVIHLWEQGLAQGQSREAALYTRAK